MEEPATAQLGRIHDVLSRWKRWIFYGVAFIAGLAAFLNNLDKIGGILGLTKAQPLKVTLLYDSLAIDSGAFGHPGDWLIQLKAVKRGPGSARHCKIEIQYDGRAMTIRRAPYGESFSLPDGELVREVQVAVIPLPPNSDDFPYHTYRQIFPKASMFCDKIASQEVEIPVPESYLSHDPTRDK
ncbi:MAG: hypothetical protein JWP25_363 [Bradyrhizobium sp.]|nr:hypothetical protein [Bradyrhizobium sp.]